MRTVVGRTRSALRAASMLAGADREQFAWIMHRETRVAYLGWLGRGNLGDEAMYRAVVENCQVHVRPAPLHAIARALARGVRIETLILGGGTLIGRDEWATRLEGILAAAKVTRLVVLGTGCEDVERALQFGIATEAGLRRWTSLLADAEQVGVRGPDSRATLAGLGISSEVVGDPALLAYNVGPSRHSRGGQVGVSVADVADGLGRDRKSQLAMVRDALRFLSDKGLEPVWFSMTPEDERLAHRLAGQAEVRPYDRDLTALAEFLDGCSVVLAERLHGGILAMTRGVPAVLIGYKPKVLDFARSVGCEPCVVDLESLDARSLSDQVIDAGSRPLPEEVDSTMIAHRDHLLALLNAVTAS